MKRRESRKRQASGYQTGTADGEHRKGGTKPEKRFPSFSWIEFKSSSPSPEIKTRGAEKSEELYILTGAPREISRCLREMLRRWKRVRMRSFCWSRIDWARVRAKTRGRRAKSPSYDDTNRSAQGRGAEEGNRLERKGRTPNSSVQP